MEQKKFIAGYPVYTSDPDAAVKLMADEVQHRLE